MNSRGGRILIIAVFISTLLTMSSGAQASGLFSLDGERAEIGLFQQAIQWLGGAWNGLTSVFELSGETPAPPPVPECTTNCGGDAGPGIDPIG